VQKVGRMVLNKTVDNFFAETEQVAFCTNNIVPGIDFSNDPLLQARNFSYLDTQLSRLGTPNFAQIPINAPHCPVMNFQQDGHMAMHNPKGRTNYEPNSFGGSRENPGIGLSSYPALENGTKTRLRSETFADHYSQARQFYISQTPVEQGHIADALIFELSKVDKAIVRERIVGHLENIDKDLAERVAGGLGMKALPPAAQAAKPTKMDLPASPALSILKNGPTSFKGRKLGILVSDGVDAGIFNALKAAATAEGADVEVVAPTIGGVDASDGSHIAADDRLNGGPSVLFDAVAVLTSADGAARLASDASARDFISDAYANLKYIGYNDAAASLLNRAGVETKGEAGIVPLKGTGDAGAFISECRKLRIWDREEKTKMSMK
jgi:catalase